MSVKNDSVSINYPRFIADKPEGKDLYLGKSQTRIAENIVQFLSENEKSNRKVIGIEGEWGSGKSNVIEILKSKLIEKFYFFVFDAWGHQEDLARRSILEELLNNLINDEILKGDKNYWNETLKSLLAKKKQTQQKSVPKLSASILLSIIGILLIPVTKFLAENFLKTYIPSTLGYDFWNYILAGLILMSSFIFLLVWFLYSLICKRKSAVKTFIAEFFYIYRGKEIENTSEETISENEPSVRQFIEFLSNIEKNTKRSLVIVFDNMDRLPVEKVKEIWSSIHTFFASDSNDLKTWAIVPFDNAHICDIFKEEDGADKLRADSYIHKTFSIVFHVPPPILSDWKEFFFSKFKEAFGNYPPSDQFIESIYDYHHSSDPKIKPRDIICFINDLVALKKLWGDAIQFKYIALYALKRSIIMLNPFSTILSKEYLGSLSLLFEFDEKLDTNIAALAFNVPLDKADEILLRPVIENVLKGNGDFSRIYNHNAFFSVFDSVFLNSKPDIIHTITCLDALPGDKLDNPKMYNYWVKLSDSIFKLEKFEIKYVVIIKTLARRLKEPSQIERILKFLFDKSISLNESKVKFYIGAKYYELILDVESLLKEIFPSFNIVDLLPVNNVDAAEYFEFIKICPDNYEKYKINCENQVINSFLITKYAENTISEYYPQINTIKVKIDLSVFKTHVEGIIPVLNTALPEYQAVLTFVYGIGKNLSLDGRLAYLLPENITTPLLTAAPAHECAVDLLLSIVKANIISPLPAHTAIPICKKMLSEIVHTDSFIQSYSYYFDFDELIKYYMQFPSALIKNVIIELTKSTNNLKGTDVSFMLSNYVAIKSTIFDEDISLINQFISKVNSFTGSDVPIAINTTNLSFLIPIFKDNASVEIELIKNITTHFNKYIVDLDKDNWLVSFNDWPSSLNIALLRTLLDTNKLQGPKLSQHCTTAYLEFIGSISKKEIDVPSGIEFWNKLYNLLSGSLTTTFKTIRDTLLNYSHGPVSIEELQFFEQGLFKYGKLDNNQEIADETLRRIFIPLANDTDPFNIIFKNNSDALIKIIEKSSDSLIAFKNALEENCHKILFSSESKHILEVIYLKCASLNSSTTDEISDIYSGGFKVGLNISITDKVLFWEIFNKHPIFSNISNSNHDNTKEIEHFTFCFENVNPLILFHFEKFLTENNINFKDSKIGK